MAAWEGLGVDLVGRILAHLPCSAHRVAFRTVCKHWRNVEVLVQQPPQLPWLLLPSVEAEVPFFFCISCRTRHSAFLRKDVRTARFCGSGSHPSGWFVLAFHQQGGGHKLHNLRRRQESEDLDVPDVLLTADGIGEMAMVVLGAALSAAPTVPGACLAVVLDKCASPIAFWLPGMAHLSPPTPAEPHERASWRQMLPRGKIADVIYYAGHGLEGFHVLTDDEEVLVYIPEIVPDGTLTTRLVTYRFPILAARWEPMSLYTVSRYLLNLFGQLVMVVRYVSIHGPVTRDIHAFRLRRPIQGGNPDNRQAYWQWTRFPDNVVVILGRFSSMAFVSPAVALEGIYFLDDTTSFDEVRAALLAGQPFPCTDMGRCTVHHHPQQFEPVFPTRPPSEFSHAVWFFHSDPADV